MQVIKGFVTINQYINNVPGNLSTIGELSTWASTYSREKGEYQFNDIPDYKLITFKSVDSDTNQNLSVEATQGKQILNIVKEAVSYAQGHIRPYNGLEFLNHLVTTFFNKVTGLHMGNFVDNGDIALPEWISWTSLEHNGNEIKIWLANQAFLDQYDEYEILVIPPLTNLDELFGPYNTAVTTINSRNAAGLTDLIQNTKGSDPETFIRALEFNYINRQNVSQITTTNWTLLIYGKAGDNVDAIKDAITDYLLANSTHTTEEWITIFPDIFKRTEFVILPRWDKLSIPNLTVNAALYSSILNPAECITFAQAGAPFYAANFVANNTHIVPYDYKAISLLIVNGNDNALGKQSISEMFADYIPVPSTSLDFNRMQLATRDWMILIERLLIAAEDAGEYSTIPIDFRRIKRNGILFITALMDGVNYLVAAKSNAIYNV